MVEFAGELLVVNAAGVAATKYLQVEESDSILGTLDADAFFKLCGFLVVGAAPALEFRNISGTRIDGSAFTTRAVHFSYAGRDYYMLASDIAPESIARVNGSVVQGPVGGLEYLNRNMTLDDEHLFAGKALVVRFNGLGEPTGSTVGDVVVSDDDGLIQFDGQNGAPDSETGAGAQALLGGGRLVVDFNHTDGSSSMMLVEVTYRGPAGVATFEALRVVAGSGAGGTIYYIPRTGSVDLAKVQTFLGETELIGSPDGLSYADFGLGGAQRTIKGNAGDNFLQGNMLHDRIFGNGGADQLIGGMGDDLVIGGDGDDEVYGGSQYDNVQGGNGNDLVYGGIDHDQMFGGAGNDELTGGWGDDVMSGGDGNDRLYSGSDNDLMSGDAGADLLDGSKGNNTLNGGAGVDTLIGGGGLDVFVFTADGVTDRISDFTNGQDKIDLDVGFAALTITTLAPGRVQIAHGGELIIVTDVGGSLTAAAFTAADFL